MNERKTLHFSLAFYNFSHHAVHQYQLWNETRWNGEVEYFLGPLSSQYYGDIYVLKTLTLKAK